MKQKQQPDKTVVDHYILQPSLVLMQLQSKLDSSKKKEELALKRVKHFQKALADKDFEIGNLNIKLESMTKMTQFNEQ